MKLIVYREWIISQYFPESKSLNDAYPLAPGIYEVDRMPNPFGLSTSPWIGFIKDGGIIGATENFWRQFEDSINKFQVQIVED